MTERSWPSPTSTLILLPTPSSGCSHDADGGERSGPERSSSCARSTDPARGSRRETPSLPSLLESRRGSAGTSSHVGGKVLRSRHLRPCGRYEGRGRPGGCAEQQPGCELVGGSSWR